MNYDLHPDIIKAKEYASFQHEKVNQLYDGKKYAESHLKQVYEFGLKYIHLIPEEYRIIVLQACWLHDVLEDCHVTFNDLVKMFGLKLANIVYALTNEKGRNREERANAKYYKGIRNTPFAIFVKLMDRFANLTFSKGSGSSMFKKYVKELPKFIKSLKGLNTLFGNIKYNLKKWFRIHEMNYEKLYNDLEKLAYD